MDLVNARLADALYVTFTALELGDIGIGVGPHNENEEVWFKSFRQRRKPQGATIVLDMRRVLSEQGTYPPGPWLVRLPLLAPPGRTEWLVAAYNRKGVVPWYNLVVPPVGNRDPYYLERYLSINHFMQDLTQILIEDREGHVRQNNGRPFFYFGY